MADFHLDAKSKKLGRLASEIAGILQGKKTPLYDPRLPGVDRVILKNYKEFMVTGKKMKEKVSYRHTGYMGHLKRERLHEAYTKNPKKVIQEAVRRMLPKNFLQQRRMKRLVFVDS